MPELPEVETIARGLQVPLVGRTFTGATVAWPRTIAPQSPDEFSRGIAGRRVRSIGRRGKYIVITLDQGYLLVHLMMTGRLKVAPSDQPLERYTHTVLGLDNGCQLRFRDVRKFGRLYLVEELSTITSKLGPEPLAIQLEEFEELLARRSGRLKSLLLNQGFLAGMGNIYADESLFQAGLHPQRTADTLTAVERERWYGAIQAVLTRAIRMRGTTLRDGGYVDAQGEAGDFQSQLAVYGRTGEPCRRCATPVQRLVLGGRSSHFCPQCQT
jgi:formamidopyrimidine-DNA glycosylase